MENYNINERVIQILPGDSMYWWKKVKDVLHVVDGELGFYNLEADLNAAQVRLIKFCILTIFPTYLFRCFYILRIK